MEQEYCNCCGQLIRKPNKYTLSKNLISILWKLLNFQRGKTFFETEDCYQMTDKGSPTAFLTQLKYFGAIRRIKDETGKHRSGKWQITKEGEFFLLGFTKLPSYVVVLDKRVREKGPVVGIKDPSIKWQTEDDIWNELQEFWSKF